MEAPDKPNTAEGTAHFFQNLPANRKASAHRCYDSDSVVQCVLDKDVAYHAPGANHNGLGYELAGYSKDDDWSHSTIESMLRNVAHDVAEAAATYKFPLIWRTANDLKRGLTFGVTSHVEITNAWHLTDHTDPGPSFPIGRFMELCGATPFAHEAPASVATAVGYDGRIDVDINGTAHMATLMARDCGMGDVGWYELTADGGIQAKGGAPLPFDGIPFSYPGLPQNVRNAFRVFFGLSPSPSGRGWIEWSHDGAHYEFIPNRPNP